LTLGSSAALAGAYGLAVSGVMVVTSLAMFPIARHYWNWGVARTALVWGALTAVNGAFLCASSLKFVEGGFVPLAVGNDDLAVGPEGDLCGVLGEADDDHGGVGEASSRVQDLYGAKRGVDDAQAAAPVKRSRASTDANALGAAWHPAAEFNSRRSRASEGTLYNRQPLCRDRLRPRQSRGSIISVEVSFGFMEEPNVERLLEEMARHREIDLPTDRRQWVVHVSQENLLPAKRIGLLRRLRLRLFLLLRLVSQPAYYYYELGDEVQLSVEIIPVRVR
jgi:KUP system potassium uptake protein